MPERHFPEPWLSVEELDACFVVKDLNGQALAYVYFEKESRQGHPRSELLTRDEARRIAAKHRETAGAAKALANRVAQTALQKPQRKPEKIGAMVKCDRGRAPSRMPPATRASAWGGKLAGAHRFLTARRRAVT
jgi:hypothetical protein